MTPADELRAAVTKLRDTAAHTSNGPWRIRSGNNVSSNVAQQDGTLIIDGGGWTDGERAVVYGAALHADAAWIALANPELAEPLATLLESAGGDMAEHGAVEGSTSRKVHPASPLGIGLMEPRDDWTAALAIARVINGGAR